MESASVVRLYLAFTVTLVGACITYFMLGQPSLIGIDDANITHVYARNIAEEHGYVYTPGYERVEGSTSILWTLVNAAVFAASDRPEIVLLAISFLLTVGAIYFSLCIYELLMRGDGTRRNNFIEIVSLFLVGVFGFYAWNVFSLMDSALWTFLLNGFVLLVLLRITGSVGSQASIVLVSLLSVTMGMSRPEAMALVPLLLLLALAGEWRLVSRRREALRIYGAGIVASALTTAGLALFRMSYFSVPFPNTYYAKVSQDWTDNLRMGATYFLRLVEFGPYADTLVLLAGACFIVSGWRTFRVKALAAFSEMHQCLFVVSGAIVLVLVLPLATGGDHFLLFRLYQPIYPLMFVLVFAVLLAAIRRNQMFGPLSNGVRRMLLAFVWVVAFMSTMGGGNIVTEFEIAEKGRVTGELLNKILKPIPDTRVAVTAAGGIAFAYHGRVIDLLGLNWPRMAHATGKRSGKHGHSAFDAAIFWDELPELVLPVVCDNLLQAESRDAPAVDAIRLLVGSDKFRKLYAAVAIPAGDRYVAAYARRDWIQAYSQIGRLREID